MRLAAVPAGERLGRYEIVRHLATGGMAEIYLARAAGIGAFERYVVVKVIARERRADQHFVRMFLDEARLAAALNHANVAQVIEVGEADGEYFYAMEYVHGDSVRTVLEDCGRSGTRIPLETALAIAIGAASGLHHAHDRLGPDGRPLQIVHRDVSPSNIMVGYDGSVKVLDFGIARASERHAETESGVVKGKYAYMAPEQCRAQGVDRRADVFSLGIVLYELATQVRAFKAESDFETMMKITTGALAPPSAVRPGFPPALEAIILRALAVDPAARYQTAHELGDALEAFTEAAGLSISQRAVERFMQAVYGTRPEPWRTAGTSSPSLPALVVPSSRPSAAPGTLGPRPLPLIATPSSQPSAAPASSGPRPVAAAQAETSMGPAIEIVSEPVASRSLARPLAVGLGLAALGVVIAIVAAGGGGGASRPEAAAIGSAGNPSPSASPDPSLNPSPSRDPSPSPSPSPSPDPSPSPSPSPDPNRSPTPKPGVEPVELRDPAPAATMVAIELRSDPSGATVYVGNERRGTTPMTLRVPQSKRPVAVRLERTGNPTTIVSISAARDVERTVKLNARRRGRTGGGSGSGDETFTNPFSK